MVSSFPSTCLWIQQDTHSHIVGPIPNTLTNLTRLEYLYLFDNNLEGISHNVEYVVIWRSHSSRFVIPLQGKISEGMCKMASLKLFIGYGNKFQGTLYFPGRIHASRGLHALSLPVGPLPASLWNMRQLAVINVLDQDSEGESTGESLLVTVVHWPFHDYWPKHFRHSDVLAMVKSRLNKSRSGNVKVLRVPQTSHNLYETDQRPQQEPVMIAT